MPPAAAVPATRWALLLLWVVPALWATNYIIARLADGLIAPHALALGRWSVAAVLLLPWVGRGLWARRAVVVREWRRLLVLGFLGMYVCGAWVYVAGHSTTSTNIGLIYSITPMTIAAASTRLLHERMAPAQWAGVVMALLGLLLVLAKGDPHNLLAVRLSAGDLWILAAAASWTAYSVLLKRWPTGLGPGERLCAIILGALVFLLPATLVEAAAGSTPAWTARASALVLLAATVPGVLSYGAYAFLQQRLGASRTALMLYLTPVYGALLAWLVLGEVPSWYHLAGAALILPSIALATRRAPQPNSPGARAGSSPSE